MCLVKRSLLSKNFLPDINELEEELKDNELYLVITKLLDTRMNNFKVEDNILSSALKIVELPSLEELEIIRKKEDNQNNPNPRSEFINQYGNTTIIALLGVLFITLGLTIMTILIGR